MKNTVKILLPLIFIAGLWGCDLDRYPKDAIGQDDDITMTTLTALRAGCYNAARGQFGGTPKIIYEMMADYLNSSIGSNNTYGDFIKWQFKASDGEVFAVWRSAYTTIANINFFFRQAEKFVTESTDDEEMIRQYKAELTVLRAMVEQQLLIKFCKSYAQVADPTQEYGIPMMREYNVLAEAPARNTLAESYQMILDDLKFAEDEFDYFGGDSGISNATKVNHDCIYALRAQILLQMGKYAEAAAEADNFITGESNIFYRLINDPVTFMGAWIFDGKPMDPGHEFGAEFIFTFFANKDEGGSNYGEMFIKDPRNDESYFTADLLPTQGIYDLYADTDIRKNTYFAKLPTLIGTQTHPEVILLSKYPGNPDLKVDPKQKNYLHANKLFRLAEMYLIAAEGYAMSDNEGLANERLTTLREARDSEYVAETYSGDDLMEEIKTERLKEMVMEGIRISDLKRWGDGFKRMDPQTQYGNITLELSRNIEKAPSDFMFVWPIPLDEIAGNKAIRYQQNPGWPIK